MAFVGGSWVFEIKTWHVREPKSSQSRHRVAVFAAAPNRRHFLSQLDKGEARLCVVGMSNCGKSFRSSQLNSSKGFELACVDDKIEGVLEPELVQMGYSGISGLAAWMGMPYDERFNTNQNRYLEVEEKITSTVEPAEGTNFVLDTTGSVVYLPQLVLSSLRDQYLIVHFYISDEMISEMIENYFRNPKPVVWGDAYNRRADEDGNQALRRCYPELLRLRREKYEQLAHVSVPAEMTRSPEVDCDAFLELISERLSPCFKSNL